MARCRISANLSLMATVMIIFCLGNSLTDAIVPFDKILRSRSVASSSTVILTKTMMQNLDVYSGLIEILPENCHAARRQWFGTYSDCVINRINNDGTITSICDQSMPELQTCQDSFIKSVESDKCIPEEMKENFAIVKSATVAGNDFLCRNKGEQLKKFVGTNCLDAAFDSECYQDQLSELQMSFLTSIISGTTLHFARDYHSYLKGMQNKCVPDQCRANAKLAATFKNYFESMRT